MEITLVCPSLWFADIHTSGGSCLGMSIAAIAAQLRLQTAMMISIGKRSLN